MQLTGRTDMATEFVKGKNGIRCEAMSFTERR